MKQCLACTLGGLWLLTASTVLAESDDPPQEAEESADPDARDDEAPSDAGEPSVGEPAPSEGDEAAPEDAEPNTEAEPPAAPGGEEVPLADEPLADEPLADEPLADEPLADEPLADEPLADEPLAETDGVSAELPVEAPEPPLSYEPFASLHGEYRFRVNMMSDIPLTALPRADPTESAFLGQNYWAMQWLRLRGEIGFEPELRLVGEADVLYGVAFGDLAQGTSPAAWPRDEYGYPGLRLRQLYLQWISPVGMLRVGQMAFSWGLGMVSNGGDRAPVFGDYRYGDMVRRVFFGLKPLGLENPLAVAVAFDWVAWDLIADFERREDVALQGVLAVIYDDPAAHNTVGAYGAYRHQENVVGDLLEVVVADVFVRWNYEDGDGGRYFVALEAAYVRGTTTFARTVERPVQDVEQIMGVLRLGRLHPQLDIVLETGVASGDSNTYDAIQSRGTMDPDHRVGLIMFPEVLAAQTARAAHLAQAQELAGRPSRGSDLIPTNGGVAGAFYLFPYVIWRPLEWLDARLGGVFGYATADVVDPFQQQAFSRSVNYRGGDAGNRNLGFEVDAALRLHSDVYEGLTLSGGLEGGLYLPGSALNDAAGVTMGPVGLLRVRVGASY